MIIQAFLDGGDFNGTALAEQRAYLLEHSIDRDTKGWTEADVDEAHSLLSAAKGLCRVDAALTHLIWQLLVPYAARFREIFVHEGFISFDGLLIRARNLVRDHLRVREELKRQYRTILIDEFQDTDPIQYEILLYLAEQPGNYGDRLAQGQTDRRESFRRWRSQAIDLCIPARRYRGVSGSGRENHQSAKWH